MTVLVAGLRGMMDSDLETPPGMVIAVDDETRTGRMLFRDMPRDYAASDKAVIRVDDEALDVYIETSDGDVLAGLMNATTRNFAGLVEKGKEFESLDDALDYVFTELWKKKDSE